MVLLGVFGGCFVILGFFGGSELIWGIFGGSSHPALISKKTLTYSSVSRGSLLAGQNQITAGPQVSLPYLTISNGLSSSNDGKTLGCHCYTKL